MNILFSSWQKARSVQQSFRQFDDRLVRIGAVLYTHDTEVCYGWVDLLLLAIVGMPIVNLLEIRNTSEWDAFWKRAMTVVCLHSIDANTYRVDLHGVSCAVITMTNEFASTVFFDTESSKVLRVK